MICKHQSGDKVLGKRNRRGMPGGFADNQQRVVRSAAGSPCIDGNACRSQARIRQCLPDLGRKLAPFGLFDYVRRTKIGEEPIQRILDQPLLFVHPASSSRDRYLKPSPRAMTPLRISRVPPRNVNAGACRMQLLSVSTKRREGLSNPASRMTPTGVGIERYAGKQFPGQEIPDFPANGLRLVWKSEGLESQS